MPAVGHHQRTTASGSPTYSYRAEPLFRNTTEHEILAVVEIFTQKFPELGFLHLSDFTEQLRASHGRILVIKLAAVFALCSRLLPSSPGEGHHPHAASQQYAAFVQQNIWPQIVHEPGLDVIHCLLLIAQYEWGEGNGFSTWMYTGIATRMYQGLQARSETFLPREASGPRDIEDREKTWRREIHRRSIWACFIMECTVGCGKDRPVALDAEELALCLPATEDDFDLGTPALEPLMYTQLRGRDLGRPDRTLTIGDSYTVTIRSIHLFSNVCRWVGGGGRTQSSALGTCPWRADSPWHQLKTELIQWRELLHERLQYPQTPLSIYIRRREGERFALLNFVHYLSLVILYREYVPFIPVFPSEIQGPVDPPLLTEDAPAGWWQNYTSVLFDAAAQITNLIKDLHKLDTTFYTPIVGYSVFTAASMHVYLAAFPWADPRSSAKLKSERLMAQDLQYLKEFAEKWPLGKAWLRVARRTQKLYRRVIVEGSYWQHQNDVVHLRKAIEQYGTLSPSRSGDDDELEHDDINDIIGEPVAPMADLQYFDENVPYEASGVIPASSRKQHLSHSDDIDTGEQQQFSTASINDWSVWGQNALMGQQVGDVFNLLDLSQQWN